MATSCGDASSIQPVSAEDVQLSEFTALGSLSASNKIIVSLYGFPGTGKTFLLNQLKQELRQKCFTFYEGSQMIADIVPGGLDAFQKLEEGQKAHWRQLAINTIGRKCVGSGQVAVVAVHFMFWPEEEAGWPVYTQSDLATFTHIIYLDVPVEIVVHRRHGDTERYRPSISVAHLSKWQQAEKFQLLRLCYDHGILFSVLSPHPMLLNKVLTLLLDFQHHTESFNLSSAKSRLDEILATGQGPLETVMVMDADRMLAVEDIGTLFWNKISPLFRGGIQCKVPRVAASVY